VQVWTYASDSGRYTVSRMISELVYLNVLLGVQKLDEILHVRRHCC
jgi:hypothetical protein